MGGGMRKKGGEGKVEGWPETYDVVSTGRILRQAWRTVMNLFARALHPSKPSFQGLPRARGVFGATGHVDVAEQASGGLSDSEHEGKQSTWLLDGNVGSSKRRVKLCTRG
jgi:hypothetical protein